MGNKIKRSSNIVTSINPKVKELYDYVCENNNITMSKKTNSLIEDYLKSELRKEYKKCRLDIEYWDIDVIYDRWICSSISLKPKTFKHAILEYRHWVITQVLDKIAFGDGENFYQDFIETFFNPTDDMSKETELFVLKAAIDNINNKHKIERACEWWWYNKSDDENEPITEWLLKYYKD